jgi:hypothetical protein
MGLLGNATLANSMPINYSSRDVFALVLSSGPDYVAHSVARLAGEIYVDRPLGNQRRPFP